MVLTSFNNWSNCQSVVTSSNATSHYMIQPYSLNI
jgi:hypothetical protein